MWKSTLKTMMFTTLLFFSFRSMCALKKTSTCLIFFPIKADLQSYKSCNTIIEVSIGFHINIRNRKMPLSWHSQALSTHTCPCTSNNSLKSLQVWWKDQFNSWVWDICTLLMLGREDRQVKVVSPVTHPPPIQGWQFQPRRTTRTAHPPAVSHSTCCCFPATRTQPPAHSGDKAAGAAQMGAAGQKPQEKPFFSLSSNKTCLDIAAFYWTLCSKEPLSQYTAKSGAQQLILPILTSDTMRVMHQASNHI